MSEPERGAQSGSAEFPRISVVIPAYNCRPMLGRLLRDLARQTYPKELYEVLVVDDGSTDGTAEAAEEAGARVLRLGRNLGRTIARETCAREARHDFLMFIDVRSIPEEHALENAAKLKYLPLMGVSVTDKRRSLLDRVFYCIGRRVYHPYEPQARWGKELWITKDAFDGMPKGLGMFAIERGMFLRCNLEDKRPDVSDDTKLLLRIVQEGTPILRHTDLSCGYDSRQEWGELLRHTFYRGPKFYDYYLTPGGPYFRRYLAALAMAAAAAVAMAAWPWLLVAAGLLLLLAYAAACAWVSEDIADFAVFFLFFPPIGLAFVSGILFAQAARITGLRKLIRH